MIEDVLRVLWFFAPAYVANMAPVLIGGRLRALAVPLDGGATFRGRRVFGDHKTVRGLVVGVAAGMVVFEVQAALYAADLCRALAPIDYATLGHWPGALLGFGALAGDALKSFFKRQVGIVPGASWLGPDQLDFFAGAVALGALVWTPPLAATLLAVPIVFVADVAVSALGFSLGMKEAWI